MQPNNRIAEKISLTALLQDLSRAMDTMAQAACDDATKNDETAARRPDRFEPAHPRRSARAADLIAAIARQVAAFPAPLCDDTAETPAPAHPATPVAAYPGSGTPPDRSPEQLLAEAVQAYRSKAAALTGQQQKECRKALERLYELEKAKLKTIDRMLGLVADDNRATQEILARRLRPLGPSVPEALLTQFDRLERIKITGLLQSLSPSP